MSHPAFLFPLYHSNNLRPAKFTPAGDTDTIADAGTERYVVYDLNGTIGVKPKSRCIDFGKSVKFAA